MKPANDPNTDYKALVRRGYNHCAAAYDQARRKETEQTLTILTDRLTDGAAVLDIGCGGGVPLSRDLARRAAVTGVDISGEMIALARYNVPAGTFIQGDIMALDFPPARFDAVVGFYAIFHLPREEHGELFRRIHQWLKPGGYLLATLSARNEPAYTQDDFFDVTMYWRNFGLNEYRTMLQNFGFKLLEVSAVGHGYGDGTHTPDEHHPLIFAQKGTL